MNIDMLLLLLSKFVGRNDDVEDYIGRRRSRQKRKAKDRKKRGAGRWVPGWCRAMSGAFYDPKRDAGPSVFGEARSGVAAPAWLAPPVRAGGRPRAPKGSARDRLLDRLLAVPGLTKPLFRHNRSGDSGRLDRQFRALFQ